MIDKYAFHQACKSLTAHIRHDRRGIVDVYMGGHQVLAFTIFGDSVLFDSRHWPSLKLCYFPTPKQIAVINLMVQFVKPAMKCIDIGAGCGFHSLMLAYLAGEDGKIYSFERQSDYFTLLERNVSANGYKSVICLREFKDLQAAYIHANTQVDFIHIYPEEDLITVFEGLKDVIFANQHLSFLCYIDPIKLLKMEKAYEGLFSILHEMHFEAYLLPDLDLLTEKEQLTRSLFVSPIFFRTCSKTSIG